VHGGRQRLSAGLHSGREAGHALVGHGPWQVPATGSQFGSRVGSGQSLCCVHAGKQRPLVGLHSDSAVGHGVDGQINLGNSWLNSTTLEQNSDAVAGWGNALNETGDILFYGCNVAANSDGQSLLDSIAGLTGADVAASEDITGHEDRGGTDHLDGAPDKSLHRRFRSHLRALTQRGGL